MKKCIAALIFFTRLPLYKWVEIPAAYYKNLVAYWSMAGWLTAGITALTLWLTAHVVPMQAAVILAIGVRLLFTGALHEDGLADFFDGFGGGHTRDRILAIMKDSHIGTYGVIGLIFYFALWVTLLSVLSPAMAALIILVSDPGAKFASSIIINRLPYARKEEESKALVVYTPMSKGEFLISALFGVLPLMLCFTPVYWLALLPSLLFMLLFTRYLRIKIGGYTGDCCGALFLLNELLLIFSLILIHQWN